jgi:hypothetical protein
LASQTMTILRMLEKKRAGVGWGDIEHTTWQSEKRYLGAPSFLPHFCMTLKWLIQRMRWPSGPNANKTRPH